MIAQFALIPAALLADPVGAAGTLLSSMFLHGGLGHILGNIWFLQLFGDNVEGRLGRGVFAIFYMAAGLAAGLLCVVTDPGSSVPMVGASGAIAGVLGAYLVWYPAARIKTLLTVGFFFRVVEVPAWVFIGLWFALQLFGWLFEAGAGVAWGAHVGGFALGALWAVLDGRGRPEKPDLNESGWYGPTRRS